MRTLLLTAIGTAALATGTGATLAGAQGTHGVHAGHHRARVHHSRVRTERFGDSTSAGPTTTTTPTTPTPTVPVMPQAAGTIASFANGMLTIKLNDGTMVSGRLSDATDLRCDMAGQAEDNQGNDVGDDNGNDGGSGHGGSDHSGPGRDGNGGGDNGDNGVAQSSALCTIAAVTPDTVVMEAELRISSAGAIWDSLELVS
jgi:hypothetical protein